jgi:hypothetical protein
MKTDTAITVHRRRALALCTLVVSFIAAPGGASFAEGATKDPKAIAVIEGAVAELGGERYLGLKGLQTTGVYSPFSQGQRGLPIEFIDTFVYPDSERTEFGKKKSRIVQSNSGGKGWKFDATRETLEDQTETELRNFRESSRSTLENLLRSALRDPAVAVASLGRSELVPRQRVEGVAVDFPDKVRIEVFFDIFTKVPVAVRYREGGGLAVGPPVEIRFYTFVEHGGIKFARIIDFYRDGFQTGRAVTDGVIVNPSVTSGFFTKPATAKDVK